MVSTSKNIQTHSPMEKLRIEHTKALKEATETKGELQKARNELAAVKAKVKEALDIIRQPSGEFDLAQARRILEAIVA